MSSTERLTQSAGEETSEQRDQGHPSFRRAAFANRAWVEVAGCAACILSPGCVTSIAVIHDLNCAE